MPTPEKKFALQQVLQINPRFLSAEGRVKRAALIADFIKSDDGFDYYWSYINNRISKGCLYHQ